MCFTWRTRTDSIEDGVLATLCEDDSDVAYIRAAQVSHALTYGGVLDINYDKRLTFIPWCTKKHWRLIVVFGENNKWAVMDPKGYNSITESY